ncbi:integrase, catalytic region, zinc finger, CCHC-type containing protein, partial [Tanacetum coccineum]
MSTSDKHQQSLADAGSETRPPMLERGSYITWHQGYKKEDLRGDDLKHYEAKIEAMNLILISISNDIYNFVDACTTAKATWQRVERLMRGTVQNKVDQEIRFNNENGIIFPKVTINTKFLNCLQPEWLKYVTQVRLAKRLTEDSYDDLFDYLQQFKKLVDYDDDYQGDIVQNNSDDPLTSAMILLARAITRNFSNPTNNHGRNTRHSYVQEEVIKGTNVQNDAGNIQRTLRTTSSGTAANVQCYNCSEKGHYARNCPKPRVRDSKYFMKQMLLAKQDEAGVILTDEHNDFLFTDASRMEEIEELSANICLMARIQPANIDSNAGPSYDYAILSEYSMQPKIINNTIGNDQIDSNIIFDEPNDDVNNSSIEYDNNVQKSYELEQLARNAYKEAEKQQIVAKKVQQQNIMLTKQLEVYKEKVRVFEMTKGTNTNYFNEYIEADRKAKRFEQRMFMLGPKPMSFYDSQVKHGLGYANPYTLKKAISQNPKLYDASCLDDSKIHMNVRDTKDILEDATKSQIKMKNKMKDPIVIQKKQNVSTIDYKKLNALYEDFVPQRELSAEQKYFPSSFISPADPSNEILSYSSSVTKPTKQQMPSTNPILVNLNEMENDFQKLFELLQTDSKRESIFYTSPEEIRLNDFLTLKHEIECCVMLNHECVDHNMQDEIEKVRRDSIEIQEGMQKCINILENDVQICQKESLDFELELQREKERRKCESSLKNVCETSWISKMENLKSENMYLGFKVQTLIKERDNVKIEYQKLFDSIKKTCAQTQGEINELIENVKQKAYAYADVRAQNQDLLMTISELKARLKNVENGLGHNLFSVGQFCDDDLEVAFRSKTCYVRNLEGDDLLIGDHEL